MTVSKIDQALTCDFCNPDPDRIVSKKGLTYAMLSLWPVSEYHTLIIPSRHVESEKELTNEEVLAIAKLKLGIVDAVAKITGQRDYNFGINVGEAAGVRIPHIHYHLIFRKFGDTPDPKGGIRNVIPQTGQHDIDDDPHMEWVLNWAQELKDIETQRA